MTSTITRNGVTLSACCEETVSRAIPGQGPWSCDNCHREVTLAGEARERRIQAIALADLFPTRHACPDPETLADYAYALKAARLMALGEASQVQALVTTLAQRVESHDPEMMAEMFASHPVLTDAEKAVAHIRSVQGEAARTACLAMGVPVEKVAPIDYPTITRYYLHVLNLRMS